MLKSLQPIILHVLLLLPFVLVAQANDNNIPAFTKISALQAKEKELISKAFKVLNSNDDKKVAKIAHNLLKTVKTEYAKFNANLLLAYYYKNRTLIDSSNFYVRKSLQHQRHGNDSLKTRGKILAYNILAINYKNKGLLEESKKWHLKGIAETDEYKETDLYYKHTHGLARTYADLGDYAQALKLFEECLTYKGDPEIIYGSYINISSIHSLLKDYGTSNKYLKKASQLLKEDSYKAQALAVITLNLGVNYQEMGEYEKAITHYKQAEKIADDHELQQIALITRNNLGDILTLMGNYKDAELILSLALYNAIELGLLSNQMTIYENLKDIAIKRKDYKTALSFVTKYFNVKDSINLLQKDEEINELEIKFQTLQKEKEIKLLQAINSNRKLELRNQEESIKNLVLQQEIEKKENENNLLEIKNTTEKIQSENIILKKDGEILHAETMRQKSIKNIMLYSFLILLIPVIGLLIIYYQKLQTQSELNKKQKEISQEKITSIIKDQELKVIKASIKGQDKERKRIAQELHDSIGGNLAAIKIQLNNPINKNENYLKTINTQIDDTYEQVRNLSHNLIPKKFSKNNFCDVLEEYISNIGGASSLTTSFIVYPRKEIDFLEENLQIEIFKIIQELITNTIKHAKATSIELQINLVDDIVSILFEDNGVGFDASENSDGIGFRNIKSRLHTISGILYIDSRIKRGTIINIEIPNLVITNTHEV